MKKYLLTILCSLFLVLTLKISAQNISIVIVGDEEKKGGYLVEITKEAFQQVGYEAIFKFIPWVRALNGSIEGEYTMLLAAYYTDERAEKLIYSNPIGRTRVFLLKRKELELSYKTLEDLKPYRIGHIRGSKVNPEFDEAEVNFLTIDYEKDAVYNIRKLLYKRIDLIVEKEERIQELLRTEFAQDADSLDLVYPPLQINNFYNCVSKIIPNAQQIIDDFNRGLKIIEENGRLEKIYLEYGVNYK